MKNPSSLLQKLVSNLDSLPSISPLKLNGKILGDPQLADALIGLTGISALEISGTQLEKSEGKISLKGIANLTGFPAQSILVEIAEWKEKLYLSVNWSPSSIEDLLTTFPSLQAGPLENLSFGEDSISFVYYASALTESPNSKSLDKGLNFYFQTYLEAAFPKLAKILPSKSKAGSLVNFLGSMEVSDQKLNFDLSGKLNDMIAVPLGPLGSWELDQTSFHLVCKTEPDGTSSTEVFVRGIFQKDWCLDLQLPTETQDWRIDLCKPVEVDQVEKVLSLIDPNSTLEFPEVILDLSDGLVLANLTIDFSLGKKPDTKITSCFTHSGNPISLTKDSFKLDLKQFDFSFSLSNGTKGSGIWDGDLKTLLLLGKDQTPFPANIIASSSSSWTLTLGQGPDAALPGFELLTSLTGPLPLEKILPPGIPLDNLPELEGVIIQFDPNESNQKSILKSTIIDVVIARDWPLIKGHLEIKKLCASLVADMGSENPKYSGKFSGDVLLAGLSLPLNGQFDTIEGKLEPGIFMVSPPPISLGKLLQSWLPSFSGVLAEIPFLNLEEINLSVTPGLQQMEIKAKSLKPLSLIPKISSLELTGLVAKMQYSWGAISRLGMTFSGDLLLQDLRLRGTLTYINKNWLLEAIQPLGEEVEYNLANMLSSFKDIMPLEAGISIPKLGFSQPFLSYNLATKAFRLKGTLKPGLDQLPSLDNTPIPLPSGKLLGVAWKDLKYQFTLFRGPAIPPGSPKTEWNITVEEKGFLLQAAKTEIGMEFHGAWKAGGEVLGINTFLKPFVDSKLMDSWPIKDIGVREADLSYKIESESRKLTLFGVAAQAGWGEAFLILETKKAATEKAKSYVVGWQLTEPTKFLDFLSEKFPLKKALRAFDQLQLIWASAPVRKFSLPPQAFTLPDNPINNAANSLVLGQGANIAFALDLSKINIPGLYFLRPYLPEGELWATYEAQDNAVSVVLDGSLKLGFKGSKFLTLTDPVFRLIKPKDPLSEVPLVLELKGILDLILGGKDYQVQFMASIAGTNLSASALMKEKWEKPMGLQGLTIYNLWLSVGGVTAPEPSIMLGLQGQYTLGSDPQPAPSETAPDAEKRDYFSVVMDMTDPIPNPLAIQFSRKKLDLETIVKIVAGERAFSLPGILKAIKASKVEFSWARALPDPLVLPDGTILPKGFHAKGDFELFGFKVRGGLCVGMQTGATSFPVNGDLEMDPIAIGSLLRITRDDNNKSKGPVFQINQGAKTPLVVRSSISLFGTTVPNPDVKLSLKGMQFPHVLPQISLNCTYKNPKDFTATGKFTFPLKMTVNPGFKLTIPGLDKVKINTVFEGVLIYSQQELTIKGSFGYGGKRLNLPPIRYKGSAIPDDLSGLEDWVKNRIKDKAGKIFSFLKAEAGKVLAEVEEAAKQAAKEAEEKGKELAESTITEAAKISQKAEESVQKYIDKGIEDGISVDSFVKDEEALVNGIQGVTNEAMAKLTEAFEGKISTAIEAGKTAIKNVVAAEKEIEEFIIGDEKKLEEFVQQFESKVTDAVQEIATKFKEKEQELENKISEEIGHAKEFAKTVKDKLNGELNSIWGATKDTLGKVGKLQDQVEKMIGLLKKVISKLSDFIKSLTKYYNDLKGVVDGLEGRMKSVEKLKGKVDKLEKEVFGGGGGGDNPYKTITKHSPF